MRRLRVLKIEYFRKRFSFSNLFFLKILVMNLRSGIWDRFFYCPSSSWYEDDSICSEEIILHTRDEKKLVCLYLNSNAVEKQGTIFLLHGREGNASKCVK